MVAFESYLPWLHSGKEDPGLSSYLVVQLLEIVCVENTELMLIPPPVT